MARPQFPPNPALSKTLAQPSPVAPVCFGGAGGLYSHSKVGANPSPADHARDHFYTPLATASAITSLAPAPRNVLAQLSIVAPVVKTSSKITSRLPLKTLSSRTAKASRRFFIRASASSFVWVGVSFTRRRFRFSTVH